MRAVGRDAVVVNLAALSGVDAYAPWRNQLWTTEANSAAVLNQLSQQEVFIDDVDEPVGFLAVTNLLPLTWSFDFLTVVAVLIAVVSLTGLALFVAARARRQRLSAVMLRRMGLSRRGLQAALATELIGIVTAGWIIGSLTGIAGLSLAASTTDPYPGYPPSTLLQYPTAIIALTGAGLLIAGLALSAVTGRAAKPDEAAQILRTTEQ
ncbi:MAG: FtsX-like permease family protein [Geodermatophilaceae bacterium]